MSVSGIPFRAIPNVETYFERHAHDIALSRYKKIVHITGNCMWAIAYSVGAHVFFQASGILNGETRVEQLIRNFWMTTPIVWAMSRAYLDFPSNPGDKDLMKLDWDAFTFVVQEAAKMPREGAATPHGIFRVIKKRLPEYPVSFQQQCDSNFLVWIRDTYTILDGSTI